MGFTSDACWFLLIKTLLIKNNKNREAALKNEAGGEEKHVFLFYLAYKLLWLCRCCFMGNIKKIKKPLRLCSVLL